MCLDFQVWLYCDLSHWAAPTGCRLAAWLCPRSKVSELLLFHWDPYSSICRIPSDRVSPLPTCSEVPRPFPVDRKRYSGNSGQDLEEEEFICGLFGDCGQISFYSSFAFRARDRGKIARCQDSDPSVRPLTINEVLMSTIHSDGP